MNYGGRPFRGPGPYGGGPWGGPGPSRPPFQQRPFPPSPFQQPPHRQQYQQQYGPPHTQPPPTSYPQRLPPSHTASHSNPGPPMQAQHHMRPPRNSPTPASASSGDTEKVPFVGYEATVYIGMENAPAEFGLELRLSGEKGANLDYLSQATKAKVVLWGHGTGINERKPLHLYIVHDTLKGKEEAVSLANHLVRTVKDELCDWRKEQDLLKHRKTSHKRRSRSPRSRSPLSDAEPPDEKRSRRTMRGRSPVERDEKHHRSSDPKAGPAEAKQADNSQPTMDVLIIADSRGVGLDEQLYQMGLSNVNLLVFKEATIEHAISMARRDIHRLKPGIIIVLNGLWNITVRREDKKTALRYDTLEETVDQYKEAMCQAFDMIRYIDSKVYVCFGPVTGISLTDYNCPVKQYMTDVEAKLYHARSIIHPQQELLNHIIMTLANVVPAMNAQIEGLTPWLLNIVHTRNKGKPSHNYGKLVDGCHPNSTVLQKWAQEIKKCIDKIKTRTPT